MCVSFSLPQQETPKKPPRRKLVNQKKMVKNSEGHKNGATSMIAPQIPPKPRGPKTSSSSPSNSRPNSGESLLSDNSGLLSEKLLGMDNRACVDYVQRLDLDKNDNTTDSVTAVDNNNRLRTEKDAIILVTGGGRDGSAHDVGDTCLFASQDGLGSKGRTLLREDQEGNNIMWSEFYF